jgi:hypothetical protein
MEIKRNHILDYKGADFKSFDMQQSIEFASAEGGKIERGMCPAELEMIWHGLELLGHMPITVVETGMGWGYSSRMFILHMLKYGGEFHSIEIFPRLEFLDYLEQLGLRNYMQVHQADARKFNHWDKPIDFLNIDSEHAISNVLGEYFRFRLHLNQHRALVGFHDSTLPAVARGLEMLNEIDNLEPIYTGINTGGFGYHLYRLQYLEKKEFPDYTHCALTEEQKSKLPLTLI